VNTAPPTQPTRRLLPGDPLSWDIHVDESCQNDHRYIVIGALACRADQSAKFVKTVEEAFARQGGTSELKWGKIRKHNTRMYKAAIADLSPLMKTGNLRFHCIVIDSWKSKHRDYNEGDADLGFTKYTFTLLFKFARIHSKPVFPPHFYVHLDKRDTPYNPDVTRSTLNYRDAAEHGRDYEAYKVVHFVDSKESRLIQMADIFTGIVAADWNRSHTAAHKQEMVDFLRARWVLPALNKPAPKYIGNRGLDIWFLDWEAKAKKWL
jgi:hypothetical protein